MSTAARLFLLLVLLVPTVTGCAEATSGPEDADSSAEPYASGGGGTEDIEDSEDVEVPDVARGDGADAISSVEAEGLTATLVDANDEPGFDDARDATGCEVIDQDPTASELVEDGSEVTISVDCAQLDWDNQEGSTWELFDEAYTSGFDAGCEALFGDSPNGSLYEDDVEYTSLDCQNENPGGGSEASDVPVDVPDDPETAGTEVGELDGCTSLFENQGVVSLNYAETSLTDLDCPLAGTLHAADPDEPEPSGSKPRKTATVGSRKRAGDTCVGEQSDGTAITAQVNAGKVSCAGAEALWNEYLRRAPSEGVGSGGLVELDGWTCIGASAAQAPRAGTCDADDSSGSFTVFTGE